MSTPPLPQTTLADRGRIPPPQWPAGAALAGLCSITLDEQGHISGVFAGFLPGIFGPFDVTFTHIASTVSAAYAGLEVINLRIACVYGPRLPRARIPKILVDAVAAQQELHLPEGGDSPMDHTYVDDIVEGVRRIGKVIARGREYTSSKEKVHQHP